LCGTHEHRSTARTNSRPASISPLAHSSALPAIGFAQDSASTRTRDAIAVADKLFTSPTLLGWVGELVAEQALYSQKSNKMAYFAQSAMLGASRGQTARWTVFAIPLGCPVTLHSSRSRHWQALVLEGRARKMLILMKTDLTRKPSAILPP
jgi:hypothetical protein